MSNSDTVRTRNRELADRINEEALRDPQSPYTGKYVGIANGRVVTMSDDPEEVLQQLEQIERDPANCLCFEAGIDYDRIQEIWRTA